MKSAAQIDHLSSHTDPVSIGDDGELLSNVFCTQCGSVNPVGTVTCITCGSILAEQGSDVRARLARIRRLANNNPTHPISELLEGSALPRRMPIVQKRDVPLNPEHQRRLEHIAEIARRSEQRTYDSSFGFGGWAFLILCYGILSVFISPEHSQEEKE